MDIAIIGPDGQLGSDLVDCLGDHTLHLLTYPDFDITQEKNTRSALSALPMDILINTAAYNRVDHAEREPYECLMLNSFAVRNLAQICADKNSVFVHFSSDYVFDGSKKAPYIEEDHPRPVSVYGVSKLAGEIFASNAWRRCFLIRTCGLFGKAGCWGKGMNFVDRMLSLGQEKDPIRVVNDQWITPTSTFELANNVRDLIYTDEYGIYHMTNEGMCTWYDFAREIFRLTSLSPRIAPVSSEEYGALAKRPGYSVLENKRAKQIGLRGFSDWESALKDYLRAKGVVKT